MSASILEEYDEQHALCNIFATKTAALVADLLAASDLRVHSVTWRVKQRDSLARKIARPDKAYKNLAEITDICGIRITTYYAKDVDLVGSIIAREFAVDSGNSLDKRDLMDSDRFGYLSIHQVVALSPARLVLSENKRFTELKCEIQTRSILQHAWAEIEHDLGYKAASDVPRAIRHRFSRLAGLLELVDEEFASLRDELRGIEQALAERIRIAPELVAIDAAALRSFIANDTLVATIDAEIVALSKTWTQGEYDLVTTLVRKFLYLKVATIGELRTLLRQFAGVIAPLVRERSRGWLDQSVQRPRGDSLEYLASILAARTDDVDLVQTFLNINSQNDDFRIDEGAAKSLLADYRLVTATFSE